ncbi:hypothetical protein HG531_012918 [Fusarium graminearum]|nr:hypothetical protein HG531_012918 [Fusarium graminearum]
MLAVNVLINGGRLELLGIQVELHKLLDPGLGVVRAKVALVLLEDDGLGLLAAKTVTKRSLNSDLIEDSTIVKLNGKSVGDGSELGVMVILGVLRILNTLDLLSERLDKRRGGSLTTVGVVGGLETAKDEHGGAHVLDAVVTVGKVVHGLELLVDNSDASLVGSASDGLDVGSRLALGLEEVVNLFRGLDGGLRVELGCDVLAGSFSRSDRLTRVGDLEENVLHDIASVGALELKLLTLEEDIVETPDGSGQNGGNTLLALEDLESEVDGTLASITGSPRLSGHGLGDSIGNLLLVEAEHLGDDGGRGDLDEDNVVKTDLVVGVEKSQAALNLVGLDHGLENILDDKGLAASEVAAGLVGTVDPVGDSEDGTEVVRGVTPLSSEPAVVEVEPSDHGTNVEGGVDGVKLEGSTRDLGTVGDNGAGDDGSKELRALLEPQSLEAAAESVEKNPSSSVEL